MKKNINFLFDNYEDNFFLPNGINPNLIESYREQKNIEGVDWETFFDKMLNEHHFVMDKSGKYPNKKFGVFYTRTIYENILKHFHKINKTQYQFDINNNEYFINLKHIDSLDNNEENYYIINLFGNEDFLFMDNGPYAMNGNDFTSNVSYFNFNKKVIEKLKTTNLKLIIATFHEGGVYYDSFLEKLYKSINHYELNANNILYINADAKNEISFNKYFETNKIVNKVNTLFTNYLLCHSLNNYSGQPLQHNIIEPTIKENNFLIFNRSVFKDHRMWVLAKLEEKKVLDTSLYSIIFPYKNEFKYNTNRDGFGMFCSKEDFKNTLPMLNKIKEKGIVMMDSFPTTKRVNYDDIDPFATTFIPLFENSYVSIVTESSFSSAQISEKIAKPLRYLHPFIVIGGPNYLKKLKEMGFKTFDKWWDESYDDEIDDTIRMQKVLNLIESLNNSTLLQTIYEESKDIVMHNARLCKYFDASTSIKTLFNNIFLNEAS
jgi:hypothetical protein